MTADFWDEEGSNNPSVWCSTAVDAVDEIGDNLPDPSSIDNWNKKRGQVGIDGDVDWPPSPSGLNRGKALVGKRSAFVGDARKKV